MKAILTISFIALFTASISAQETWRIVEDSDLEKLIYFDVYNINDKIYTFSSTISPNEPIPHVKTNLMQYDYQGNVVFDSLFGSSEYTFVGSANLRGKFEVDNFYMSVAHRYPVVSPHEKSGVLIMDTNYNIVCKYVQEFTNPMHSGFVSSVTRDSDSTFVTSNYFVDHSDNNFFNALKVLRLTYLGDTLATLEIPSTVSFGQFGYSNIQKHEDYFYLLCSFQVQNNQQDPSNLHIYKLNENLEIISSSITTDNRYYYNNALAVYPNGDFVVGGMYSSGWNSEGVWIQKYVRKYDKNMNVLWQRLIGKNSMGGSVNKLIITEDGGVAGVGTGGVPFLMHTGDSAAYSTGVAFKFSGDGELLFYKDYYGLIDHEVNAIENILWDIDELSDGSFVVCGEGKSFWPFYQRGWIMRIGPDGYLEGPGNDLNIVEIDGSGIFLYPNPATDELRVKNAENVKHYQIYDMSGALALEGNTFPIVLKPLSPGAYIVRLALNNNQNTNHKIFVK